MMDGCKTYDMRQRAPLMFKGGKLATIRKILCDD
jgi:hypothetical protein